MPQTGTPISNTEPIETSPTVQLLVADAGNRSAISGMLDERFDVETSQTVTDADLYLIEDHLFPEYRGALREQVEREHPAFCPVVLIRRETTDLQQGGVVPSASEEVVPYDEVVDAPIDPPQLIRRLKSLLVRRQQSRELMQQVLTLEEREQRLRLFKQGVESTGNGVVITDSTGTIEYVNPAFESIVGYTEDVVLGESPQILLPEGSGEIFDEEFWRTMTDQTEWVGDIVIEAKDSHRLVVKATTTALSDAEDETHGFVIVLSDITERIQREQELEDREEELDLLRQILTRYLRHNLRNDLNVIQGSAAMLNEDETLSPAQIDLGETIIEKSEDLLKMSDSARTYSSLLERKAPLSPFDLVEITTKAVDNVREGFPDVAFEIDAPETCGIRAREGIQRAFEELFDNAARHNDATDPWVRIQVRDHDGARLVIEDNGPGIPEQERSALERGSETQLSHSQGIGLWLSKWIIEGVDGQLSIEQSDSGTRVLVEFPPTPTVGSTGLEVTTLKEREQRFQTVTDRMTDAIIRVEADWNVTVLDGHAEEMLNIDRNTVVGSSFWEVFSTLQDTQFETIVRNAMEARLSLTVEGFLAETDSWLEFNVYPEFDGGLSFYTRDVTEERTQERKREEVIKRVTDAIVEVDSDWRFTLVNEQAEDLYGMDEEYLIGRNFWNVFEDARDTRFEEEYRGVMESRESTSFVAYFSQLDGWFDIKAYPKEDGGIAFYFVEVTEQHERKRALEQANEFLSTLFETIPAGVTVLDTDGRITRANSYAEKELGLVKSDITDRTYQDPAWEIYGQDGEPIPAEELPFSQVMETGESVVDYEHGIVLPDGSKRWLSINAAPITGTDGAIEQVVAVIKDLTDRGEFQEHLEALPSDTNG